MKWFFYLSGTDITSIFPPFIIEHLNGSFLLKLQDGQRERVPPLGALGSGDTVPGILRFSLIKRSENLWKLQSVSIGLNKTLFTDKQDPETFNHKCSIPISEYKSYDRVISEGFICFYSESCTQAIHSSNLCCQTGLSPTFLSYIKKVLFQPWNLRLVFERG